MGPLSEPLLLLIALVVVVCVGLVGVRLLGSRLDAGDDADDIFDSDLDP